MRGPTATPASRSGAISSAARGTQHRHRRRRRARPNRPAPSAGSGQPRVRLREWHSTPEFDFLDAEHDGYLSLPDPVVHRRRVIFVKPGYWILVDDLSGAARHQVDLTFQFAPLDVALGPSPVGACRRRRTAVCCGFPHFPRRRCSQLSNVAS